MAPPRVIPACASGQPGIIYYLLQVAGSIGLFRYHLHEQREVRLFHCSAIPVLGMTHDATAQRIILANTHPSGSVHLDVYDKNGNYQGTVTGGDSVDAAPSRIWGLPNALVYPSAGLARHPKNGQVTALEHTVINRLNFITGEIDTVLDDLAYDQLPSPTRRSRRCAVRHPPPR